MNETLLDHFRRPRNLGSLPRGAPDVGTGEAGDADAGARVRLQLRIDADGHVTEARFKAFGCSATIAAASWTSERVCGQPVADAAALDGDAIARALELPAERRHAADLAEQALRAALADLRSRRLP